MAHFINSGAIYNPERPYAEWHMNADKIMSELGTVLDGFTIQIGDEADFGISWQEGDEANCTWTEAF